MTTIRSFHTDHGAEFTTRAGRAVPAHYGRPERAHRAVRNGVGVFDYPSDVVIVTGDDRVEFLDNAVTNKVSAAPGTGCLALLLTPNGRIRLEMYVYTMAERLLLFLPPGAAPDLLADWREKVFIQDVTFEDATEQYAVFGVHGPNATEKLASVVAGVGIPDERFRIVEATIADASVSIVPTDAPCGEESFDVICQSDDAEAVFDSLLTGGYSAIPFGLDTWESLTLEAGNLLFDDIVDRIPNVVGMRSALDFEKGCYVGQEVVSRLENRGQHNDEVVGLSLEAVPEPGQPVEDDGESIGEIIRAGYSPILDGPIAIALVDVDHASELTVNGQIATVHSLPFVEGSALSGRLPTYRA